MGVVKDIKDKTPNQDLISILEEKLADAKKGDLRTAIFICGWDDDAYTHGWVLDNRNTCRRMLGELSMLQYDMLTNIAFEDGDTVINRAFED